MRQRVRVRVCLRARTCARVCTLVRARVQLCKSYCAVLLAMFVVQFGNKLILSVPLAIVAPTTLAVLSAPHKCAPARSCAAECRGRGAPRRAGSVEPTSW